MVGLITVTEVPEPSAQSALSLPADTVIKGLLRVESPLVV
jgi:hypothetical protein